MTITPETVAAVNAVLSEIPIPLFDKYGTEIGTRSCDVKLDASEVAALLLALAKCEPVRGLHKELADIAELAHSISVSLFDAGWSDDARLIREMSDRMKARLAALAPFAEVE